MGLRGPKTQPTPLRIIRGNPGKRALPKDEPKPRDQKPYRPEYISNDATALQEWERLSEILTHMRVLTEADYIMLASICVTYATMVKAQKAIVKCEQEAREAGSNNPEMAGLVHVIGRKKVTKQKADGTIESVESPGYEQVSVLEALVRDSIDKLGRLCAAFGLSPASRPGIHAAPEAATNDPWSEL